jgi:hypothetical protein
MTALFSGLPVLRGFQAIQLPSRLLAFLLQSAALKLAHSASRI